MIAPQSDEKTCFNFLPRKPVVVQRQHPERSGDAGLLPVAQFDA